MKTNDIQGNVNVQQSKMKQYKYKEMVRSDSLNRSYLSGSMNHS